MNWDCPYCNRSQTVTRPNYFYSQFAFDISDPDIGPIGIGGQAITCANLDCQKVTVVANIIKAKRTPRSEVFVGSNAEILLSKRLMPESSAKPQPDYIPSPIREDYYEACKIRDLSPKASATLSRRCLQGMIRDFAGVSEKSLYTEIEKLKTLAEDGKEPQGVSADSIDALHHLRSLGNIGAHMERDIDVIVSVDPDEAQVLIELIETLLEEWYVARHKRQSRFSSLKTMAEEKETMRKLPPPEIGDR